SDPRFRRPYSGSYWQVEGPDGPTFRSRSLWDVVLRPPLDSPADGGVHRHRVPGPDGQRLIAVERTVTLPDVPEPYRVVVATDEAPQRAASMRGQITTMTQQIDYQLARARAAASLGVPGARVPVAPSVAAIQRTLEHLYVGRDLQFAVDIPPEHVFRGEQQDLEEMLGNLMDNACKWARRRVAATSRRDDGRLTITVEDDGPGLPAEQLPYALAPGARLDEKVPGTGLGLAIVRDLASLYSGSIALARSSLGGLQAALTLPAGYRIGRRRGGAVRSHG